MFVNDKFDRFCMCVALAFLLVFGGSVPNVEQFIKENKLGVPTGCTVQSGFAAYPIYEFDLQRINRIAVVPAD